jgi:hypothetical protein
MNTAKETSVLGPPCKAHVVDGGPDPEIAHLLAQGEVFKLLERKIAADQSRLQSSMFLQKYNTSRCCSFINICELPYLTVISVHIHTSSQ